MKLYRIREWAKNFEIAESKRRQGPLAWVAVPVKLDGAGYRRLMKTANGLIAYGAWMALVQVAARCSPRGDLAGSEGPYSLDDLSVMTDIPLDSLTTAVDILASKAIRWLEVTDASDDLRTPADASVDLRTRPTKPSLPDRTVQDRQTDRPEAEISAATDGRPDGTRDALAACGVDGAALVELSAHVPLTAARVRDVWASVNADGGVRKPKSVLVTRLYAECGLPRSPPRGGRAEAIADPIARQIRKLQIAKGPA